MYPNPMYQNQMYQTPYNTQMQGVATFSQQGQQLIRVNGIEGARAYQMSANSTAALFDSNQDIMYIKQTDGAGFPSIRLFKFTEVNQDLTKNNEEYVTRKELEEYVKQFISSTTETTEHNTDVKK